MDSTLGEPLWRQPGGSRPEGRAYAGEFNLAWIEEATRPDDYAGYTHLRVHGGIPIAAGENLHTVAEFTALIQAGGVDFPEPDLTT